MTIIACIALAVAIFCAVGFYIIATAPEGKPGVHF